MFEKCWLVAGLAGLVVAAVFACSQVRFAGGMISQAYVLDDDARQHLTPFVAARNPEAFHDRFVLDYSDAYLPGGYRRLMLFISRYTEPLTGSKYLGLGLMLCTMVFAILAGGRVGGVAGAGVALAMATRSDIFTCHVYAGLFRSFAVPMALLHMFLLFSRRHIGAAFSLLAQALFYPPLSIINIPVTVTVFLTRLRWEQSRLLREALPFAVVISMALAALYLYGARGADYGSPIRLTDAELMCEWYRTGRMQGGDCLPLDKLPFALNDAWQLGLAPGSRGSLMLPALLGPVFWRNYAAPVALLLLFLTGIAWNRYAAGILAAVAGSGVALHMASRANYFVMGYPGRYLDYSLPFVVFMLWPVAWGAVCKRWGARSPARFAVFMLGAVVLFAYPWRLPLARDVVICREHHRNLYAALENIEDRSLITAWTPNVLDDIPLMTGREVLFSIENAHPIYMPYYREARNRILDTVALAFATNVHAAIRIRDRYGITHLVLENRLAELYRRKPPMFMPFYKVADLMRRRAPLDDMIFHQPPLEWVFYGDCEFTVIDLGNLPAPAADEFLATLKEEPPPAWSRYPSDIKLVDMRVVPESTRPDGSFVMEYVWRAPIYTVTRPYLVFVHFNRDGEIMFTGDHLWLATLDHAKTDWRTDGPVMLTYRHAHMAPDMSPDAYDVQIGLINRRTGRRIMPVKPVEHDYGAVCIPVQVRVCSKSDAVRTTGLSECAGAR